jgi:hypothetical protein
MDVSDDLSIPNSGHRGSRAGRYGTGRLRRGIDPHTRRLILFAGALGVILAALIGASVLMGRQSGEVPVVTADSRPIREKPVNPGGMKIDGAASDVFSAGSDTEGAKLAAASESPDVAALHAPAAPPPAPTSTAPTPAPVVEAPAPPVMESVPAPVPAPGKPAVAGAAAPPAPKPAPAKPLAAAAGSHPATPSHQLMVQLAALTSEESARTEWAKLTKKMPDLLNGHQPSYFRTEREGHTFWRVRTAGFADMAQARSFCDRVRAKGAVCVVADF